MKLSENHPVRKIIRYASIPVVLFLIYLLVREIDLETLISQLRLFSLPNFALVILNTFICYYLAVIAWHMAFLEPVPVKKSWYLFLIHIIGESLAQINPTNIIAGESLKAYLCKDRLGIRLRHSVVSLMNSRMMVFLSTGTFFLVAVIMIARNTDSPAFRLVSTVLSTLVVLFFIYTFIMLKSGHGVFFFAIILFRVLGNYIRLFEKTAEYLSEIDNDMVEFYMTKRGIFFAALLVSIIHKVVGSAEYYIIFHVMGIDSSFITCVLFDTVSTLARSGGFFIPGQIGIEEFSNKLMFSIGGIPGKETWLTVSLVRRGRQLFWIASGFLVYTLFFHGSMSDLKGKENQKI